MSKRAWVFVILMYLAGGSILLHSLLNPPALASEWQIFALLLILTTLSQLFRAEAPNHQLYHPAYIFLFSGVLLLDSLSFNLIVIVSHLAEWYKERQLNSNQLRNWYIQPFNIAMHILLGMLVRMLLMQICPPPCELSSLEVLLGAILGGIVYAGLNHVLVGTVVMLARRVPFRESKVLDLVNVSTDFIMLMMGYSAALLIDLRAWLVIPAIAPLFLIYRALSVPHLKKRANTDPKTGLWNAEYFVKALQLELMRADRSGRPLTVVMADIDLLRNINNTYGHVAGDAVLSGVAEILRNNFREYDVVARFGGEEFAVLIPETHPHTARPRVEQVRRQVEAHVFESPATRQHIRATMSFGISGVNAKRMNTSELLHCADIAVYAAKLSGRNQSCLYTEELREILAA